MAKKKKPTHWSCTVLRRKHVTIGSLNITTGETTTERTEWRTEPCNVPLFTDVERETGRCRSCAAGWRAPGNYPVYKCAGPSCPGYSYKASDLAHPATCAQPNREER